MKYSLNHRSQNKENEVPDLPDLTKKELGIPKGLFEPLQHPLIRGYDSVERRRPSEG